MLKVIHQLILYNRFIGFDAKQEIVSTFRTTHGLYLQKM